MALYFAKLAGLVLVKIATWTPLGRFETVINYYNKLQKQIFFSEILAILIDAYFELLISGYGQFFFKNEKIFSRRGL